jgi:hypothetical protein
MADQKIAPGSWSKTPPLLLASHEPNDAQVRLFNEFDERHNCFSNKSGDP